jgi:xanthine dehydrogenase accessory factor
MTSTDLLARADRLRTERTPFVLATVVRTERPTSAKPGDRAIVLADGAMEGFVGGVCAESTVRVEGLRLMETGESVLLRIMPTDDQHESRPPSEEAGVVVVANPCLSGGTLDIFLEAVLPATLMHVYGDAPIARALARVAQAAGYEVTTSVDPHEPIPPDSTAVVVASHGRYEDHVIDAALAAGVPYVALVASPRRGAAVLGELTTPEVGRTALKTPAGLDIGARTPMDVAVSILAELVSVRARLKPAHRPALSLVTAEMTTAIDPVCHMDVAAVPSSLHLEWNGITWYFCGPGCKQAFADDPARYADTDPAA